MKINIISKCSQWNQKNKMSLLKISKKVELSIKKNQKWIDQLYGHLICYLVREVSSSALTQAGKLFKTGPSRATQILKYSNAIKNQT